LLHPLELVIFNRHRGSVYGVSRQSAAVALVFRGKVNCLEAIHDFPMACAAMKMKVQPEYAASIKPLPV
jgi:hypothetical protein